MNFITHLGVSLCGPHEILQRVNKKLSAIFKHSDSGIAQMTNQSSNNSCFMAVID